MQLGLLPGSTVRYMNISAHLRCYCTFVSYALKTHTVHPHVQAGYIHIFDDVAFQFVTQRILEKKDVRALSSFAFFALEALYNLVSPVTGSTSRGHTGLQQQVSQGFYSIQISILPLYAEQAQQLQVLGGILMSRKEATERQINFNQRNICNLCNRSQHCLYQSSTSWRFCEHQFVSVIEYFTTPITL